MDNDNFEPRNAAFFSLMYAGSITRISFHISDQQF